MSHSDLKKAHRVELEKLESSYKDALKVEKAQAQEKLGTGGPWRILGGSLGKAPSPMAVVGTAQCLRFPF